MSHNIKQVLLYRRDLQMRKGKIAAQCAHASMKVFFDRADSFETGILSAPLSEEMITWCTEGFKKIVLSVETEKDLLNALRLARSASLPCALITDSGATEFHGTPTNTCIAIGPANAGLIDSITGPTGLIRTKLA